MLFTIGGNSLHVSGPVWRDFWVHAGKYMACGPVKLMGPIATFLTSDATTPPHMPTTWAGDDTLRTLASLPNRIQRPDWGASTSVWSLCFSSSMEQLCSENASNAQVATASQPRSTQLPAQHSVRGSLRFSKAQTRCRQSALIHKHQ